MSNFRHLSIVGVRDEIKNMPEIHKGQSHQGINSVKIYLKRFGFLGEDIEGSDLDDTTSDALKRFQEYFNIPDTGNFDDATREVMSLSRCALPDLDPNSPAASTACAWRTPYLTFAFQTGTSDVSGSDEFEAVRRAFRTWESAGTPSFREVNTSDNPDILVRWRPAQCGDADMRGGTLAHADYPPDCPYYDADLPQPIHFDDDEHTWADGQVIGAFDVESIALHEIGHIIGLYHSSDSSAIMYPTVSSNTLARVPQSDDITGLRSLYKGRVHIHEMDNAGRVGARRDTRTWTSGWTTARTYNIGTKHFLFLLKEFTGEVHIHEMNSDGSVGAEVVRYHWSRGWTTANFYTVGSTTYLFLLKESNGHVHIHEMNSNGSVGAEVVRYDWTSGWTTVAFSLSGSRPYLFLLKRCYPRT